MVLIRFALSSAQAEERQHGQDHDDQPDQIDQSVHFSQVPIALRVIKKREAGELVPVTY
jgi:hypothetical protein